jgi:hypothetical protein
MNRSDFFMVMVNVGFMCLVASSCVVEGKAKTPAESEVWHGNQQRCNKRSLLAHLFICSSFGWIDVVMSQSHFLYKLLIFLLLNFCVRADFVEKSRKCISGHLVKRAINYYDIRWNLYFKGFRDFLLGGRVLY